MANSSTSTPTAPPARPAPSPAALSELRQAFREDEGFQRELEAWARELREFIEESSARRMDSGSSTE